MGNDSVKEAILDEVNKLSEAEQEQVLAFARELSTPAPRGEPGGNLLKLVGCIPSEDLREMEQAIEEGCEQVDPNGW